MQEEDENGNMDNWLQTRIEEKLKQLEQTPSKQQGIIDELVEDNEKLQYSLQRVGKDSEVLDWIDENMGEFEDLIWNDGIEITGNIRELINKAGGSDDNSKNKRR
jgi:hypothetical protein